LDPTACFFAAGLASSSSDDSSEDDSCLRVLRSGLSVEAGSLGLRVEGFGLRVQNLGFWSRIQGVRFEVQSSEFRVWGGFEVWCLGIGEADLLLGGLLGGSSLLSLGGRGLDRSLLRGRLGILLVRRFLLRARLLLWASGIRGWD